MHGRAAEPVRPLLRCLGHRRFRLGLLGWRYDFQWSRPAFRPDFVLPRPAVRDPDVDHPGKIVHYDLATPDRSPFTSCGGPDCADSPAPSRRQTASMLEARRLPAALW